MSAHREHLTPANAITSAALAAGFLALLAAARSNLAQATALVAVAAVLDSIDGTVARRSGRDCTFGANLDSLADLVSFGVVPAMALYVSSVHIAPVARPAASLAFLLSGAWRLARFPLVKQSDSFVGLPIPVAGLLVMIVLVREPGTALAVVVAVTAAALMVSTLPFPTIPAAVRAAGSLRRACRRRLTRR